MTNKNMPIKCYYCGSSIENSNELVEKQIPLQTKGGARLYRRKFHLKCLEKYLPQLENVDLRKEENEDWESVYQYFREEILGLPDSIPLDQHAILRLRGLRVGKFYPNGNNTIILKRGYDYEIILTTLKVTKATIHNCLRTMNFKDGQHKTNTIMKIVVQEINDVYKRMEVQKKSNEKLEADTVVDEFDYKEKLIKQKESENIDNDIGLLDEINDLFGGLL